MDQDIAAPIVNRPPVLLDKIRLARNTEARLSRRTFVFVISAMKPNSFLNEPFFRMVNDGDCRKDENPALVTQALDAPMSTLGYAWRSD